MEKTAAQRGESASIVKQTHRRKHLTRKDGSFKHCLPPKNTLFLVLAGGGRGESRLGFEEFPQVTSDGTFV